AAGPSTSTGARPVVGVVVMGGAAFPRVAVRPAASRPCARGSGVVRPIVLGAPDLLVRGGGRGPAAAGGGTATLAHRTSPQTRQAVGRTGERSEALLIRAHTCPPCLAITRRAHEIR